MNGEGTPKNYGNMVKYYTAAANQGHVQAMTELGVILVQGVMYNKNIYQAHILFNVATVLGDNSAAEKRDALEKVLKIDELLQAQSEAEAFRSKPSELTEYIKNTFGERIRIYIEDGISSTSNKKSR